MKITFKNGILVRNATSEDKFKNGSSAEDVPFPNDMPEKADKHRGHLIVIDPFTVDGVQHNANEVVFAYISPSRNEKKDSAGNFTVYEIYQ
jgi:hypothetical protein